MARQKSYGGIIEHEKRGEISAEIMRMKIEGEGFRKIAETLKSKFSINVSHTVIGQYYNDELGGKNVEALKAGQVDKEGEILKPVDVDEDRLNELIKKWGNSSNGTGKIYAYLLAMAEANVIAYSRGEDRLRIELLNCLKTAKGLL